MKKQAPKTQSTKEELIDILKEYPTKNDLKKELKKELGNYPTKEDLSQRLTASQDAFRTEMRYEFSIMKEEILAGMSKFTNLILTAIGPVLKEIETRPEDHEIGTAQMEEVKTSISNHERRITKLEHP